MAIYLKKNIAFRCEASTNNGYGHFMRCYAIAKALQKKYSYEVHFVINKNLYLNLFLRNKKIKITYIKEKIKSSHEEIILDKYLKKNKIDLLFLDIKKNYSFSFLRKIKKRLKIATIDDNKTKRLICDLCFYPPVPQIKKLNWKNFKGKKFIGWDFVPLREEFQKKIILKKTNLKNITILCGGSNLNNFLKNILKKIESFKEKYNFYILAGFEDSAVTYSLKKTIHKIFFVKERKNIYKLVNKSSIIIAPYGITAYECAALKKPTVLFARSKNDYISSSIFKKNKIASIFNNFENFNEELITSVVKKSTKYKKKINTISMKLKKGSINISRILNNEIKKK
tara:strand:- start:998 stop:2017 length:1020 start_codon:yes stop_codon:yes gene_type:complete